MVCVQNLLKNYEQDMETLTKQQKQAVEKAELMQQQDMKTTGRRIKAEQVGVSVLRPCARQTHLSIHRQTRL